MLRQALYWTVVASGALLACGKAGAMPAQPRPDLAVGARSIARDPAPTLAPFAHIVFCKRNPDDCRPDDRGDVLIDASPETLKAIRSLNARINASIEPRSDAPGPLGDVWTIAPARGDCDDFAVTKRHALIARGFPVSALRLAVARTREGIGHAVLVVRTTAGDLVLDNRNRRVLSWVETDLRLLKIQSGTDPSRWNDGLESFASRD